MNPQDLLTLAVELASGSSRGRPGQVELRRAVSSVYYALFHALANSCADLLVGRRPRPTRHGGRHIGRWTTERSGGSAPGGPGSPFWTTTSPAAFATLPGSS